MKRTVSTAHLIIGIIFAGIAALWMIRQATDASIHDTAPGFPLVLIGAGVVGLIASLANSRNRKRALVVDEPEAADETDESDQTDNEPTTVLEEN